MAGRGDTCAFIAGLTMSKPNKPRGTTSQNGKGSAPRPKAVSAKAYDEAWHATFRDACKWPECVCPSKSKCRLKN